MSINYCRCAKICTGILPTLSKSVKSNQVQSNQSSQITQVKSAKSVHDDNSVLSTPLPTKPGTWCWVTPDLPIFSTGLEREIQDTDTSKFDHTWSAHSLSERVDSLPFDLYADIWYCPGQHYDWPTEALPIGREITIREYSEAAKLSNVKGAVFVQVLNDSVHEIGEINVVIIPTMQL